MLHIWQNLHEWLATQILGQLSLPLNAAELQEFATYLILAIAQIVLIAGVMRPIESWKPVEQWDNRDLTKIDRLYTLLKLLVVVPLFSYVLIPATGSALGWVGEDSSAPLQIDRLIPTMQNHPVWLFLCYFVIYDLLYYVIHRLQHALPWWWGLHSLHHSQRQLSCWSNDRDHYLDDLLEITILGGFTALIGAAPVEYASLVLLGNLVEKFSHTNTSLGFGSIVEKMLVSPSFHRLHHMRSDPSRPGLHDCNFSLIFPIWDIMFGTALYDEPPRPCGVDAPLIDADNEKGLLAQQIAGFHRFVSGLPRIGPKRETEFR